MLSLRSALGKHKTVKCWCLDYTHEALVVCSGGREGGRREIEGGREGRGKEKQQTPPAVDFPQVPLVLIIDHLLVGRYDSHRTCIFIHLFATWLTFAKLEKSWGQRVEVLRVHQRLNKLSQAYGKCENELPSSTTQLALLSLQLFMECPVGGKNTKLMLGCSWNFGFVKKGSYSPPTQKGRRREGGAREGHQSPRPMKMSGIY